MKNRALLSAIALCFLVAGCESKKEEPVKPKVVDKVVPVPAPAPTPPPASAAQDAKPAGVAQVADTQKAAAPAPPGLKGCKRGNCKITLTVQVGPSGDCTRILKVPDPRGIWKGDPKNPQLDVPIVWDIATPDWEFTAKGIDFNNNGKFKNGTPGADKRTFTWTDVNDDQGTHAYSVNLVNPKTKKTCNIDPSIVNGVLVED